MSEFLFKCKYFKDGLCVNPSLIIENPKTLYIPCRHVKCKECPLKIAYISFLAKKGKIKEDCLHCNKYGNSGGRVVLTPKKFERKCLNKWWMCEQAIRRHEASWNVQKNKVLWAVCKAVARFHYDPEFSVQLIAFFSTVGLILGAIAVAIAIAGSLLNFCTGFYLVVETTLIFTLLSGLFSTGMDGLKNWLVSNYSHVYSAAEKEVEKEKSII